MRPEASARELQAIESEYNLSRGDDATRCTQLVRPPVRPPVSASVPPIQSDPIRFDPCVRASCAPP